MNNIKLKFYGNFLITTILIFTILFTIGLAIFNMYLIGGEEGKLVLIALGATVLFQIPTSIYLIKRVSKQKDLIIDGNQILQNNEVIFSRNDIIYIKKINLIKTEIKYNKDNEEKVIFVTIGNKKLNEVKILLSIDN
jgi:hypothetical protein